MTKTKNKKPQKGTSARSYAWVLALVIILIIVAVVVAIVCFVRPQPTSLEPSTPVTSQPDSTVTPDSTESPETDDSTSTPEAPEKTPQYEGEDPNDLEELTGIITYKGIEGDNLIVMTMLNQYLRQTGICVITLTGRNSQNFYTTSVDSHGDATVSYCEDFVVPVSVLASDTYDIEINLTGDGKTGTILDEVSL